MTTKSCQTFKNACNSACRNYSGCKARLDMLDDLLLEVAQSKAVSPAYDWRFNLVTSSPLQACH